MARHSFVRMTKIPNVCGRVDYISNPKRQEHLFATYSTVEPVFWEQLSKQAQFDFWRSNQSNGKCIEARELIIALPESLQQEDPDLLLQTFTEAFLTKYGMQCSSALHLNKAKTNYHIHLVFADREPLEEAVVKIASRNMFYDENGRHVRTKKEILDEEGKVRPGCRILKKGLPYEVRLFSERKDQFKQKAFLKEVKEMYTDLINQMVPEERDRQKVFDPSGPYLPTKKIGKNNPQEAEIRADNKLRTEWNQTVDQVLIAGGEEKEVVEFKETYVTKAVGQSIKEHGQKPGLFADFLRRALDVLTRFLNLLMQEQKFEERDSLQAGSVEKAKSARAAKAILSEKIEKAELRVARAQTKVLHLESIHKQLRKENQKVYAIRKKTESLKTEYQKMPDGIRWRKRKKELEIIINQKTEEHQKAQEALSALPIMYGFKSVKDMESAFRKAKAELKAARQEYEDLTSGNAPKAKTQQNPPKSEKSQQKESVLMKLARKQKEVDEREAKAGSEKKKVRTDREVSL